MDMPSPTAVDFGQIGVPFTASQKGASATVVLKKVRYAPSPDGLPPIAVLEVTFTGLTVAPYSYRDGQFATDNGGVKHEYSPRPDEIYSRFMPPAPLGIGTVTKGQTVDGILILRGPTGDGKTTVVFESNEESGDFTHTMTWML